MPPLKTLYELRQDADTTQEELGLKLGIAKNSVCTLEAAAYPSLRSVMRYVKALGGTLALHVEMPTRDGNKTYELLVGEEAQEQRKAEFYSRVHRVRRRI